MLTAPTPPAVATPPVAVKVPLPGARAPCRRCPHLRAPDASGSTPRRVCCVGPGPGVLLRRRRGRRRSRRRAPTWAAAWRACWSARRWSSRRRLPRWPRACCGAAMRRRRRGRTRCAWSCPRPRTARRGPRAVACLTCVACRARPLRGVPSSAARPRQRCGAQCPRAAGASSSAHGGSWRAAQPIQSRCVFAATAGDGGGPPWEDAAFSPSSVLDWPLQPSGSGLLRCASGDAAALQALRERLGSEGRQARPRPEHPPPTPVNSYSCQQLCGPARAGTPRCLE